jgi:hypothetical protein
MSDSAPFGHEVPSLLVPEPQATQASGKPPARFVFRKILGWMAVVLILTAIFIHGLVGLIAAHRETPRLVSASELYKDYYRNEVEADTLYNGKLLRVTGEVQEIARNFAGEPYLLLRTTSSNWDRVRSNLRSSEKSKLSELVPGEIVTIEGRGNGFVSGSPQLNDCKIISTDVLGSTP